MVKHSASLMSRFFTRERFGQPQVLAGLLLMVFLAQCGWLVHRKAHESRVDDHDMARARKGLELWKGEQPGYTYYLPDSPPETNPLLAPPAADSYHSNLWYVIAAWPLLLEPPGESPTRSHAVWLFSLPYLMFGVLLGASLWYVARRLYGNAGGYIALTLYCFSPGIIRACALWYAEPESGAAWGAFGTVFTAIAVAHTLYAPREVVLWNWRRIALLGLSFALAVGSQFSLVVAVPIALAFLLYLAPGRWGAAIVIWAAGGAVAVVLLLASYFFHLRAFGEGLQHARFVDITWKALTMGGAYRQVLAQLGESNAALYFALPVTLLTYLAWPRTRYFGNTAPLLVGGLFLALGMASPHYPGLGFQLLAIPFLLVFVAGVFADLLETRHRALVLACVCSLLSANALLNLLQLARVG